MEFMVYKAKAQFRVTYCYYMITLLASSFSELHKRYVLEKVIA